ncbi:alpha-mannosidase 2-like [Lineus longissimus]|uniref:alpha-mannosidase 2-like n=1 Tax=Lineus longissimus TaxID=88925 RepID=UPI00315D013B
MKLPQRLICLIVACACMSMIVSRLLSSGDALVLDDEQQRGEYRGVYPNYRLQVAMTIRGLPEECRFSEKKPPSDGGHINTYDLLAEVGKENARSPAMTPKQLDGPLQVFLIPYTHLDPGWIWTVDEYYEKHVKNILDNLVIKLPQYGDMTFVWAEVVFLDIWWRGTTEHNRATFKKMVERGQVEIVNGGWVVPDEANTHYFAIIDQLIEGHQWVLKHLGVKPRAGWSTNPFGHSATIPYLFSRSGMTEMVIVRVHDAIKARLRTERNVELRWRQSWDLRSDQSETMCHIMPYLNNSFQYSCGPDAVTCSKYDFKDQGQLIDDNNVQSYSKQLAEQFKKKSQLFRHNVVFHTIGGDFRFDTPQEWDEQYSNYKRIMKYINGHKEFNMEINFGTVADYFKAVKKAPKSDGGMRTAHGDFLPYHDVGSQYWTGLYTSRPFWKRLGRELEGDLRSAEILNSLSNILRTRYRVDFKASDDNLRKVTQARRELAVFQHHNAITGTSTERTVKDYAKRLWRAKALALDISRVAASYLLSHGKYENSRDEKPILSPFNYRDDRDHLNSKKILQLSSDKPHTVVFFNPTTTVRKELIRLHSGSSGVTIMNAKGETVRCQISPVWKRFSRKFTHTFELMFYATLLPLGMETYHIKLAKSNFTTFSHVNFRNKYRKKREEFTIQGDNLHAEFDKRGSLKYLKNERDKDGINITMSFHSYNSIGSGAYVFSAHGTQRFDDPTYVIKVSGPLVTEVRVGFGIIEHNVRIFHTENTLGSALEIENYVDMTGITKDTDIFMRLDTSIDNSKYLYTDSNGYQMVRRQRQNSFPVSGNVYPISDACYIQDKTTRLSLLAGQPHGVASLQKGQLDVFLDRKIFHDDGKGLGEGAKDNVQTVSKFFLLLERPKDNILDEQEVNRLSYQSLVSQSLLNHLLHPVVDFIADKPQRIVNPIFAPLETLLPCDVDLVNFKTMEPVSRASPKETVMILRRRVFQCSFSVYDLNCPLKSGDFDVQNLFREIRFKSVQEMSLSLMYEKDHGNSSGVIRLHPMEMAAYKVLN